MKKKFDIKKIKNHYLKYDIKIKNLKPYLYAPRFIEKIYELKVIKKILSIQNDRNVFIDVGSHIGFYSILYSFFYKKVFAFEPSKFQYDYLKFNKYKNKLNNLKIYNAGLSNKTCKKNIYVMGRSGGNNTVIQNNKKKFKPMDSYEVNLLKLDEINIKNVSLIKIDVEGYEYNVILGALKTIKKYNPLLVIEISNNKKNNKVIKKLEKLGYSITFPYKRFSELAFCTYK